MLSNSNSNADYLIINAHGDPDEGFIYLPELAEEIAAKQHFKDKLTGEDLSKFVDVKDKVVITTACGGGHTTLADVFINKGQAKVYIGDTSSPFGYVSNLFPTLIFYFLTRYSLSIQEAFERAKACDTEEFGSWEIRQSL